MLSVGRLNLLNGTLVPGSAPVVGAVVTSGGDSLPPVATGGSTDTPDTFLTIDGGSNPKRRVTAALGGISCYHSPGGGFLTLTCSTDYTPGSAGLFGQLLVYQYSSTSVAWTPDAVTITTADADQWTLSNVDGQLYITVPVGTNKIRVSPNYRN